jgi:hypothetical protein
MALKSCLCVLAAAVCLAGETRLGKPLELKETVSIQALMTQPENYAGRLVQVKGKVSAVCQKMGCWMQLAGDGGYSVRIKVKDGEIVFPKEAVGRMAIAEGTFVKTAEAGYQIRGAGAVLLD